MSAILINILIIVLICAAIGALLQYAPFVPAPLRQWGLFAVGAIAVVLIIIQLIALLPAGTLAT